MHPGQVVADYLEQASTSIEPDLALDISDPALSFPLGFNAGTMLVSLKNQQPLNLIQVKLDRFRSALNIKQLFSRSLQIAYSASMLKGEVTGIATTRDIGFNRVEIVSQFTGIHPEKFLSDLDIPGVSCQGAVNSTIHTVIVDGCVEKCLGEITAERLDLALARKIPGFKETVFPKSVIAFERTGQGPIRIKHCRFIGKQADIQLSGEITPAPSFVKSRLNISVQILAHLPKDKKPETSPGPNALPDIRPISFTMAGSFEDPAITLAPLPDLLPREAPPASNTAKQEKPSDLDGIAHNSLPIKKRPSPNNKKNTALTQQKDDIGTISNTRLDLELLGTVTGVEPTAIIKTAKGSERLYTMGDTVDRAIILDIMRMQVLLQVDGKIELLSMKEPIPAQNQSLVSSTHAPPGTPRRNMSKPVTLAKKDINDLINNLDTLSRQIQIKPHSQGGQTDGFWISGLEKNSILYKKLGLRQGDLITGLNGQPLNSLDSAAELYNQFTQGNLDSAIDLQIKRQGKARSFQYQIK